MIYGTGGRLIQTPSNCFVLISVFGGTNTPIVFVPFLQQSLKLVLDFRFGYGTMNVLSANGYEGEK